MRTRPCVKIETTAPSPAESHAGPPIEERSVAGLNAPIIVAPVRDAVSRTLWQATVAAIWPWRWHEYRGYSVAAATALNYAPKTVRRWLYAGHGVSHAASLRIIALLEARIAVLSELSTHWRRYAADRAVIEAQTTPGFKFRSFNATERAGWRSKPRAPLTHRK